MILDINLWLYVSILVLVDAALRRRQSDDGDGGGLIKFQSLF